ncbi:MAG: hypothetical protein ABRQ27_10315, partial [Clostridiaceae bacterium]
MGVSKYDFETPTFYRIGKGILSYTIKKARGAGEVVFPAVRGGCSDTKCRRREPVGSLAKVA